MVWSIYALVELFRVRTLRFPSAFEEAHQVVQLVLVRCAVCCDSWQSIPIRFPQSRSISSCSRILDSRVLGIDISSAFLVWAIVTKVWIGKQLEFLGILRRSLRSDFRDGCSGHGHKR